VLADPRARKRERRTNLAIKQAFYRLADERRETILVACSKCDWRAAFSRDDLIASHGADCAMPNLLNHLTAPNCSRLALIGIGAEFITSSRSRARGNSTAAGLQDNDVQLLKPQSRRSYRRVIKAAIIAACVALLLTRDDGPSAS
jgi:hypothetical protein